MRFGARDYSPALNRWTSKDPLGFAAGDTSLYVYGYGDPVSFVDPDGEFCFLAFLIPTLIDALYAWAIISTAQSVVKLLDPCVSWEEKRRELLLMGAGFVAGKVGGLIAARALRTATAAKILARIGCFVAGTLVLTASGPVAIEEVTPGTRVWSRAPESGAVVRAQVTAVHERAEVPTRAIGLASEATGSTVLVTTAEHPLWSASALAFVRAEDVSPGDGLLTAEGAWAEVVSNAATGRVETVYNLTVDGPESYFVGEAGVLVHNAPECGAAAGAVGPAINRNGTPYPQIRNPGTGEMIPFPAAELQRVPVANRVQWGAQERGAYIREWYDRGLPTPEGGWARYDIHHIQPREFGGTNAFDNLVPVERTVHQSAFTAWWRGF